MDLRKRRSQEKLQVALAQHLQNQTIDEITIGELTKTAGVSRQTFYSNFDSKQSILLNRIEMLFDKTRIFFEANAHREDIGREEIIEISLKHFLVECDKDQAMMRAAFSGQAGIQCLSLLKALFTDFIADRFQFQFNFNFERKQLDIITDFYAGAFIGTIQGWLMNDDPTKDVDFVVRQVGRLMPHGLDAYLPKDS
ncbi:MAG: TetR/AcrR family transcriptional regulator [Acidiferrobacterales bacterium]|nr:TetR/AcrR family transcriptional regulator [Acidiferrobacterales bacterium]